MIPRKEDFFLDFPRIVKEMGFTFSLWDGNVDRKKLDTIDVDHLIQECDLHALHDNLTNIVNYRLENEMNLKIVDQDFVKVFKLAQLSVDYLMYSLQHLLNSVELIREEYTACAKDRDLVVRELKKKEEEVKIVKRKLKEKKRMKFETSFPDHYVTSNYGYGGVYYKCGECPKAFVSAGHLRSHHLRRHMPGPAARDPGFCAHIACGTHTPCTHTICPHAPCKHSCPHVLKEVLLTHNAQNVNEEVDVVQEDMAVPYLPPIPISTTVPLIQSTTASQDASTYMLTSVSATLPHTTSLPYSSPLGDLQLPTTTLPAHELMTQFPRSLLQPENIQQSEPPLQSQTIVPCATHSQQPTVHFLLPESLLSQPPDVSLQYYTASSPPPPVPSPQPTIPSPQLPVPSVSTISSPQPPISPITSLQPRMPALRPTMPSPLQTELSLQPTPTSSTTLDLESAVPPRETKSPPRQHTRSQLLHQSSCLDSNFTSVSPPEVSLHSDTDVQQSPVVSPSSSAPMLPPTVSSRLHSATPTMPSVAAHPSLSSQPQSVSSPISMSQSVPSLTKHMISPASSSAFSLSQSYSPPKLQQRAQPLPAPLPRARSRTQSVVNSSSHPNISQKDHEPAMMKAMVVPSSNDVPPVVSEVAANSTIASMPMDDGMHDSSSSESNSQSVSLLTARPQLSTMSVSKSLVPCEPEHLEEHTGRNNSPNSSSSSQSSLCARSPSHSTRRLLLPEMSHLQCTSPSPPSAPTPELRARLEALAEDQLQRLGVGLGERLTDSSRATAQRQLEQRRRLLSKGYPGIMEKLRSNIERTVEEDVQRRLKSGHVMNFKKSFVF